MAAHRIKTELASMTKCYFELRKQSARGTESITADVMRHLHTRQHLGKALVVCDHPAVVLSAARKQWLKLSRVIQKQRASTLNADKILKYTHTIARMQHMRFCARTPLEDPEAEVYFLRPEHLQAVPFQCMTMYVASATPSAAMLQSAIAQLPNDGLIVDYAHIVPWEALGLQPKLLLEEQVANAWQQTERFLQSYHVKVDELFGGPFQNVDAMDEALDILLGVSQKFLQVAGVFQRALELARPLRISKETRSKYDALSLLAHRVQALLPGAFTQHFLEIYNEDDGFFLYDKGRVRAMHSGELLADAVHRHALAGRHNLAGAIRRVAESSARRRVAEQQTRLSN